MSTNGQDHLEIEVITTSLGSMAAQCVLLKGKESAILVDAPFTRADAYRVVAAVLDAGKRLEAVIVTHDHPDHFFGLDVIAMEFPNAKIWAEPNIVKEIERSVPIKFNRWSPILGMNAPKFGVFPKPLDADHIELEGHRIELKGPIQGDHATCQYLWIPESRTLIANDILYNQVHLFLGEHLIEHYDRWLEALDELEALEPATVVAGHRRPDLPDDSDAIAFTRSYLRDFKSAAAKSSSSQEIQDEMNALYPNAIDVVGGFLLGVSSQVASGEIAPWDE